MVVIITLQYHRKTTLTLLLVLQAAYWIFNIIFLKRKKTSSKGSICTQVSFEVCLTLLILVLGMTEIPQNRVDEDLLLNKVNPVLIALFVFCVVISKLVEFFVVVYYTVRLGGGSGKSGVDGNEKKRKIKLEDALEDKEADSLKGRKDGGKKEGGMKNKEAEVRMGKNLDNSLSGIENQAEGKDLANDLAVFDI